MGMRRGPTATVQSRSPRADRAARIWRLRADLDQRWWWGEGRLRSLGQPTEQ